MKTKHILLGIVLLPILSCTLEKQKGISDDLIGVWSGILFQTESRYDSIAISWRKNNSFSTKTEQQQITHWKKEGMSFHLKDNLAYVSMEPYSLITH